jgi:hypothetical protein
MNFRIPKLMAALACWPIATSFSQIVIDYEFTGLNTSIPDFSFSGASNTQSISAPNHSVLGISITLTIEGGDFDAYDGDYYAYVSHNGTIATLLNRTGRSATSSFGAPGNGFSVTFNDAAPNGDIHFATAASASNPISGLWAPDGRATFPTTTLDTDPRTKLLNQFQGQTASGDWTLFIADLSSGGDGIIKQWGIQITVVPEPASTFVFTAASLLLFAGVFRFVRKTS